MILDSHAHVWTLATGDYGWLDEERWESIRIDFTLEDMRALMVEAAVDQVLLVHAADAIAEVDRMIAAVEHYPWVVGVVAGGSVADLEALGPILQRASATGAIVGFRHMTGWGQCYRDALGTAASFDGARKLAEADIALEFHAPAPADMAWALAFASEVPALRVVVDHMGKPPIASADPATVSVWQEQVRALAALPNISIKYSGWAPVGLGDVTAEHVRPYLAELLAGFGPERVMFGSNWPTTLVAADYATVVRESLAALADYDSATSHEVLYGTARRVYRLAS